MFIPILEEHGIMVHNMKYIDSNERDSIAFEKHTFSISYIIRVVSMVKEKMTVIRDFWTVASYFFVSPQDFEKYGVVAGGVFEPSINGYCRQSVFCKKVNNDVSTIPFFAKYVDCYWKPEHVDCIQRVASFICDYVGEWSVRALESSLENYIRCNKWPMGNVINALRIALTGVASGIGIAEIIFLIGKEETCNRIKYAFSRLI